MSQQSKQKFVIKPFKAGSQLNAQAAEQVWKSLNNAINEIYKKNASNLSFEELYRNAYNLVLHKHGDLLYNGVIETITQHLRDTSVEVSNASSHMLLTIITKVWDDHTVTIRMIKDILMYMDRTYVVQHKKHSVKNLGSYLFRDIIVYNASVRGRLSQILLENIKLDRTGVMIDKDLMKNVLAMLVDLGVDGNKVYEEDFETPFLDATRSFYREETQVYLSTVPCAEYLVKAEQRLHEESERVTLYLSPSTEPKLKHILETELITTHARTLVELYSTGSVAMMAENRLPDLKRMYRLFSRVPSTVDGLRESMVEYTKRCGFAIIADQEKLKEPVTFVQQILDLKAKFDRVVSECFNSEKAAQKRLKDAFEEFLNKDSKCSSYLAAYVDDLFRSGMKGMSETEVDAQLERAVVIFRFLQDKDIFENFYKTLLSKRLLHTRSLSDEWERNMIAKLKTECGYQFTSKLEGMFQDMQTSKSVLDDYRSSSGGAIACQQLDVTVLTTGYWPVQCPPPCLLPPVAKALADHFQRFYLTKNSGRKLSWLLHIGNADLRVCFPSGRKELSVSTYQMCVLMLFNDASALSLEDIRTATQIPDAELRRHLLSLCTPKIRILKKSTKSKTVADDEVFTFNDEFTSKFRRVKVPLVSSKELSTDESFPTPSTVEEDRRHLVEATIVRVMKARKSMAHNDLVAEVARQLSNRFSASPLMIKKRIESLLEREYLQRDNSDMRFYNYVA